MPEVSDTSTRLCTGGKINLFLRITGVRPDGYHDLSTLFVRLPEPCDELIIRPAAGTGLRLRCAEPGIDPACNTLTKAYALYAEATGFAPGLDAELVKGIPHGAGLGGGSADGAAVLAALNHLTQSGLSLEQLEQIAVGCGADIPFCLRGGTQRAQGIGEDFSPLSPMPDCPILIIKPRFGISTKDAFARSDSTAFSHAQVQRMCQALDTGSVLPIADCLQNVFEQLCSSDEQKLLHQARQLLIQNGALGALLSGSGSALFGLFDNEAAACAARSALQDHPLLEGVFLCRPLPFGAFEAVRNSLRNPS